MYMAKDLVVLSTSPPEKVDFSDNAPFNQGSIRGQSLSVRVRVTGLSRECTGQYVTTIIHGWKGVGFLGVFVFGLLYLFSWVS